MKEFPRRTPPRNVARPSTDNDVELTSSAPAGARVLSRGHRPEDGDGVGRGESYAGGEDGDKPGATAC